MAARNGRNNSKPDITQTEINRISNALKDEQFIKLLSEYAQERNDPANKKRYETEITKLEAQRGCDVTFFNPVPGYVIKTRNITTGTKCFLNICN